MSLLAPLGYSAESCGYCKDDNGVRTLNSRACYYFSSKSLSPEVYQLLVDRGWRRSGTVFYKPDNVRHCCPHHTIRLPVAEYTPTKDHRKAINKWNRYVLGDDYINEATKLYPKSKEEKARLRNTFDLTTAAHESEYGQIQRPPEPAHRFEVTLEPDTFTMEKYGLFKNYQQHVHHEKASETTPGSFKRFLCSSPLHAKTSSNDGKPQKLGSYHQCYRLDGRLIAMGVLDLLPHCVSGVYFVYHSDFEKWSFGKLSAMREIILASEGAYKYYYMGYYIHSCPKMRYKGEYQPSYILDSESYEWNLINGDLRKLLDSKRYVSMARERRLKETRSTDVLPNTTKDVTDDYSDYPLPTAAEGGEAVKRGMSLFDLKIPGLMTVDEIEEEIDLGQVAIKDLVAWDTGEVRKPQTFKGIIAELVACIGVDAAIDIVVDLT
ncbi:arginine-tRNA-protein transferase 1 [Amniculicola lignicola CBS 123094]|uniref:arginyltransferase n=1 Tax=Amniculicola lignicola CBS 123094 TaxID=1392246 RepID=A0A6A5WY85_9PLEO|nr:arginine-tRNA-protein transferase 1 [Amniculicola lignicola CBS 123094]